MKISALQFVDVPERYQTGVEEPHEPGDQGIHCRAVGLIPVK